MSDYCYDDQFSEVIDELKQLNRQLKIERGSARMEEWRNIEDRLPNIFYISSVIGYESKVVLIYVPIHGIIRAIFNDATGWHEEIISDKHGGDKLYPTHWRYMPDPPEKIKEAENLREITFD